MQLPIHNLIHRHLFCEVVQGTLVLSRAVDLTWDTRLTRHTLEKTTKKLHLATLTNKTHRLPHVGANHRALLMDQVALPAHRVPLTIYADFLSCAIFVLSW